MSDDVTNQNGDVEQPEGGDNKPQDVTAQLLAKIESLEAQLTTQHQNFKREIDRKLDNLTPRAPTQSAPEEDDLDIFEPEGQRKLADRISSTATERAYARLKQESDLERVQTYLTSEYPQVSDQKSKLYQEANQIYMSFGLSENSPVDPRLLRAAVVEAAAKLGVEPASRKKANQTSDFSGLGGNAPESPQGRGGSKGKVDEATLAFAEMVGLNVKDEKVKSRLEKNSKRNWGKYQ